MCCGLHAVWNMLSVHCLALCWRAAGRAVRRALSAAGMHRPGRTAWEGSHAQSVLFGGLPEAHLSPKRQTIELFWVVLGRVSHGIVRGRGFARLGMHSLRSAQRW